MAISAELDFVCVDVVHHHIGQRLALITHRNMHLAKLCYPAPALAPCCESPDRLVQSMVDVCPAKGHARRRSSKQASRETLVFTQNTAKRHKERMTCSEGKRACLEHEAHNFAAEQLPRMASADAEEGGGAPRDRWGGFGCGHGDFEFCVCCLRM